MTLVIVKSRLADGQRQRLTTDDAGRETDNEEAHHDRSLILKQGTHPKIVQVRLGHSSIAVTLDTYSHVTAGLQEAAARTFDEGFQVRYNGPAQQMKEQAKN